MIFRVLGCSGSELDRSHPCSFMVDSSILVDMGSGASRLTLEEQLKVKHIFLSHAHLDHTKDLAFFSENVFSRRERPVQLHASANTLGVLKTHMFNNALWPDFTQLPSAQDPVIQFVPFESKSPVFVDGVEVYSVSVNHPGGCEALFFKSPHATVVYSGDTGPTLELWDEINKRGDGVKAVLLECSFPNRLAAVAHDSGHLTPKLFHAELQKLHSSKVAVYAYHIKAPYRDEIMKELEVLHDSRVSILEPGMKIQF